MNGIIAKRRNMLILGIICLAVAVGIALLLLIDEVRKDKLALSIIILLCVLFIFGSISCFVLHFLKPVNLIELEDLNKIIINKTKSKKEVLDLNSITFIDAQNETYRGHTYKYGTMTICTEDDSYVVKDIKNLKTAYLRLYDLCKDNIIADAKKEFEENSTSNESQIIANRTSIAKFLWFLIIAITMICVICIIFSTEEWLYSLIMTLSLIGVALFFIVKDILKIKEVIIKTGDKIIINVSKKEQIETPINQIAAVEVLFKKKDLNDCPLQISFKDGRKIVLKDVVAPLIVCDELKAIISDNII